MDNAEVNKVANDVLSRIFPHQSFREANARTEFDLDGSRFVQVDAYFERYPKGFVREQIDAMSAIRIKLQEDGDDRFVSITIFADDDPNEDEDKDDDDF